MPDRDCCSFCDREAGQSHTENCPVREMDEEYVEPPYNFDEALRTIGDGLDRRDATIAALSASLAETHAWVRRIQDVMTGYLVPDGYDADEALNKLLEMLDGPEQREIQGRAFAALNKASGGNDATR